MKNVNENYLAALNPQQLKAVCHRGSPLLILAGAGSGKTRVITTKIAWLIATCEVSAESILAVTFTNKAAREMRERATNMDKRAEQATIRTFHSFGAWMLRLYAAEAGLSTHFTIYDDEDAVTLLMKACPDLDKQHARSIMKKISKAKDLCLTPSDPYLHEINPDPQFAVLYQKYQTRLQETGNVDFGDLIMLPVQLLHEQKYIADYIHNRFRTVLIDEYQDSNTAQFQLLKALSDEKTYVCAVGDDDQSIYRFRGAEIQNILTFGNSFDKTTIIRLEENYRSYAPILRVADCIVSHNKDRLGKTLRAARGESTQKPQIFYLPNQDAEAELCVQLIQQSVNTGNAYSDWAILYRTNAQSLAFETLFLHRKIPHKVIGTVKFYEREEIKDAIALLALIANGRDEIAFRRMINKPARSVGEITQNKIITYVRNILFYQSTQNNFAEDFISIIAQDIKKIGISKKAAASVTAFVVCLLELRTLLATSNTGTQTASGFDGLAAFVQTVVKQSGLEHYHKNQDEVMGTQKMANLEELINTASLYPFSTQGLTSFLEHIELDRSLTQNTDTIDAVQLITMHNTKGLEFPNVIITGLENGIFPRTDETPDDTEEERRLMYVACTRAKDSLYMTCCATRRMYGRLSFMQPSRFLSEIDSNLVSVTGESLATYFPPASDSVAALWQCGQKIYHDDYGYGYIIQQRQTGGELIITVHFDTGLQKQFFPIYQKHSLFRVDS